MELDLPPNVCFLYRRVDKDLYHFRSEYEARQDKCGAKAVRLHANSSIEVSVHLEKLRGLFE